MEVLEFFRYGPIKDTKTQLEQNTFTESPLRSVAYNTPLAKERCEVLIVKFAVF